MSVQANNEDQSKAISKGKIKWFSEKDGYGFITNADNVDHYFTVRNIIGADLPINGQPVEFIAESGRKGPIALNITLVKQEKTESKPHSNFKDDRIVCSNCDRKIVPRIYFKDGRPEYSVCPFCASTIEHFEGKWLEIILAFAKQAFNYLDPLVENSTPEQKRKVIIIAGLLFVAFLFIL